MVDISGRSLREADLKQIATLSYQLTFAFIRKPQEGQVRAICF